MRQRVAHEGGTVGLAARAERVGHVEQEHRGDIVDATDERWCQHRDANERKTGDAHRRGDAPLLASHATATAGEQPLGDDRDEQRQRDPSEDRAFTARRAITSFGGARCDRQVVDRAKGGLALGCVDGDDALATARRLHQPEAGPIGDRRRGAGGHVEMGPTGQAHADGGVDRDRQAVANAHVARCRGRATELRQHPIDQHREGDLNRQVGVGQREAEVGELLTVTATTDEQRRRIGADEDGVGRCAELLGVGDADTGQVDPVEQLVVAAHDGDRRVVGDAVDRYSGRAAGRGDADPRRTRLVGHGDGVVDGDVEPIGRT